MSEYDEEFIENLFWGDGTVYEPVTTAEITDKSRWNTFYSQVFKKVEDGTFWEAFWTRGSTEYQDNGVEDFDFYEVVPQEITTTIYVAKDVAQAGDLPIPCPPAPNPFTKE